MTKCCGNCSRFYEIRKKHYACRLLDATVPYTYVCDKWYPSIWLYLKGELEICPKPKNKE